MMIKTKWKCNNDAVTRRTLAPQIWTVWASRDALLQRITGGKDFAIFYTNRNVRFHLTIFCTNRNTRFDLTIFCTNRRVWVSCIWARVNLVYLNSQIDEIEKYKTYFRQYSLTITNKIIFLTISFYLLHEWSCYYYINMVCINKNTITVYCLIIHTIITKYISII